MINQQPCDGICDKFEYWKESQQSQASKNEEREWWNSAVSSCLFMNRRSLASQKAILHNILWLNMVGSLVAIHYEQLFPTKFKRSQARTHTQFWLADWLTVYIVNIYVHTVKWCTHNHVNEDLWKSILWTNLQKKKSIILLRYVE